MSRTAALELAVFAFALLGLLLAAWGLVDLARRPADAWARSGVRRELWIALLLLGAAFPLPGIACTATYLLAVRRRLATSR